MKKQNWILGLVISSAISLIAAMPRLIRMDNIDVSFLLVNILYNFFFCISCWTAYHYLFNKTRFPDVGTYRLAVSCFAIIAVSSTTYVYDYVFSFFTNNGLQFPEVAGPKRAYILTVRGLVVSGLFYFICYYLHILAEKQKNSLEIEHLKQAQLSANLSSLKEQLSPHFLFNTLNTLSSLTQEKPVKDYVAELANVYRYVLQYKEIDTATLQQELAFIGSYLYIIKSRFENAIEIKITVDEELMLTKIPPLTLQLLIENAIKHNVASSSKVLRIDIKNSENGYLIVRNNFQPKSSLYFSAGIGLGNVMQRYRLLFNREIIIEQSNATFTVKLPVV